MNLRGGEMPPLKPPKKNHGCSILCALKTEQKKEGNIIVLEDIFLASNVFKLSLTN